MKKLLLYTVLLFVLFATSVVSCRRPRVVVTSGLGEVVPVWVIDDKQCEAPCTCKTDAAKGSIEGRCKKCE